jgi:hypothetical protein
VTHYVFKDLKPNPAVLNEQFAYVDGYILALEDILKDIKELQAKEATPGSDALLLEQRVARNGAYGSVRAAVNRSLQNARDTMAMLKEGRPTASTLGQVLDSIKANEVIPQYEDDEPECACQPPFPEHQWECPVNK